MIYALHFSMDVLAQLVLFLAYKHVCRKPWHRMLIWFAGTLLATIITVNFIG